jgi:hypothetical protein
MTSDPRRSQKPPAYAPSEPTLRDTRIHSALSRSESAVKRVLPWMGLILFSTATVFQAGRLVERLDPQPPQKLGPFSALMNPNGPRPSQQQLEADETARKALQAAAEAEARVRALELQLATKVAEMEESRLRAENERLRAELDKARGIAPEGEAPMAATDTPEEGSDPLAPAAVIEPPASAEQPPASAEQPQAPAAPSVEATATPGNEPG